MYPWLQGKGVLQNEREKKQFTLIHPKKSETSYKNILLDVYDLEF